jgi:hypothetical protein
MSWEIEDIVKPIFDSLIKNNAPIELMKQVFFDVKFSECFDCLPNTLKNDPEFLQECLKRNLISTASIPKNLQNQEFISRELYLSNIGMYFSELEKNLYPQDEEIVLTALKGNAMAYSYVNDEFKNNSSLMIKCLQENTKLFRFLKKEVQEEFLNNEELVKETLKTKPEIFNYIPEEKKYTPEILKSVLETDKGYKFAKDYLKKTRDSQVALMALKIYDGARKNIHQMYGSILKQNKVNENCYNFLKIYLDQKNLDAELSQKHEGIKPPKSKI